MTVGWAVRWAKNLRNAAIDRSFRLRAAARGNSLAAALVGRGVRHVAFSVAFDAPWTVELLTDAWRRNPVGMELVIIDNSRNAAARREHAEICRDRGVPWLPLPTNPEWSPNRSHGIAINWIWFNVVRRASFDLVGFVDHDCLPIRRCDVPSLVGGRSVHGLRGVSKTHPPAWNIWGGYCFIRPDATIGRTIDFKHRIELGLDTGGGNWPGFYSRLDPWEVGEATHEKLLVDLGDGDPPEACDLLDGVFLHLGGASYRDRLREPAVRARLVAAIRGLFPGRGE